MKPEIKLTKTAPKIVVGITGKIGSGKDTLGAILAKEFNAHVLNISDFVRADAVADGVSLDREELTAYSAGKLREDGPNCFLDKAILAIPATGSYSTIISGVRTPENVSRLRSEFGRAFVLVGVEISSSDVRFSRIRARARGTATRTNQELIENDRIQEIEYRISETMKLSNYKLENSGTLAELATAAAKLASTIKARS